MMGLRYGTQTFSLHSKITTAIFLTLFILHTASGVFISEDEEATGEINKRDVVYVCDVMAAFLTQWTANMRSPETLLSWLRTLPPMPCRAEGREGQGELKA
ncbi:hypothetical protein PoB_006821100 [Plakobranchus ocellatus]|uniref:Uncharacterized protein n=1 Tax=Plakobranchus ocellatus TaxID=259542 RepID=A0AAV4DCA9_9GAST|nr:hypothetical protein PoB_006821100 [Plakobranchus ocellatus]